jgi:hypothetical protein
MIGADACFRGSEYQFGLMADTLNPGGNLYATCDSQYGHFRLKNKYESTVIHKLPPHPVDLYNISSYGYHGLIIHCSE